MTLQDALSTPTTDGFSMTSNILQFKLSRQKQYKSITTILKLLCVFVCVLRRNVKPEKRKPEAFIFTLYTVYLGHWERMCFLFEVQICSFHLQHEWCFVEVLLFVKQLASKTDLPHSHTHTQIKKHRES